ncbi:hypothetical protein [Arthrobacter sp. MA-N2]|uniref:hypothetical protein n=1 Tax=Arthrobacter sp. MA-N2 TaxID=1101188 RepID=UPI0012DE0EE9|nr:hypothetical protein [Arthrobacter sp. MA-N2]
MSGSQRRNRFGQECPCYFFVFYQDFDEECLVELAALLVAGGPVQGFRIRQ